MNNPLVGGAAEGKRNVLERLDERAVHEDVDHGKQVVRDDRPPARRGEEVLL
jgi:hypothetical protein